MTDFCDIQKLVELFNINKPDKSDSEDEFENIEQPSTSKGGTGKKTKKVNPYTKLEVQEDESREIFDVNEEDEIVFKEENDVCSNWKKTPKWDISYKQQVSASDVFLQMGLKTPSTSSCEDMLITVHLPGENRQNIDLKVLKDNVKVTSPKFYLNIPLPQPVDPKGGNAQWDKDDDKLIITLRMDRELDCVNF